MAALVPIIWDDCLRGKETTIDLIEQFELNKNVKLMVWHYNDLDNFQLADEQLWTKYLKCFNRIWLASAFKGASNVDQLVPPIQFHINNHLAWIKVVKQFIFSNPNYRQNLQGIALTGWQSFDHFMTLCELLPTSLPSLALCLQTIQNAKGDFDEEAHRNASEKLGFNTLIPLSAIINFCSIQPFYANFPGSQLFCLSLKLDECRNEYKTLRTHPSFRGGFSEYAINHSITNPLHINAFFSNAKL